MARFIGSSGTLLGNAEVFQQTLQAGREDWLVGIVFADQAGNLFVDQSADGVNWDLTSTAYAVSASAGKTFKEEIYGPFVRVRYVNGATPQGVFRLAARFSSAGNR